MSKPRKAAQPEIQPIPGIQTLNPPFQLKEQEEDNWCWAAVAAAVRNWRNPDSQLLQCQVAELLYQTAPGVACAERQRFDRPASLELALKSVGRFQNAGEGRAPFDEIQKEISQNRPICARIVKDGNGDGIVESAHFVVIVGCGLIDGVEYVRVEDPEGSSFIGPLATFRDNYAKEWIWVATYFLKD